MKQNYFSRIILSIILSRFYALISFPIFAYLPPSEFDFCFNVVDPSIPENSYFKGGGSQHTHHTVLLFLRSQDQRKATQGFISTHQYSTVYFFPPYLGGSAFLPTKSAGKGVFDMLPAQAPWGRRSDKLLASAALGGVIICRIEPPAVSRAFKKEQSVSLFSEFETLVPTSPILVRGPVMANNRPSPPPNERLNIGLPTQLFSPFSQEDWGWKSDLPPSWMSRLRSNSIATGPPCLWERGGVAI